MFETAKRLGINNTITVSLKRSSNIAGLYWITPSFSLTAETGLGTEYLAFSFLNFFSDS
jgi:hypothetical protein